MQKYQKYICENTNSETSLMTFLICKTEVSEDSARIQEAKTQGFL